MGVGQGFRALGAFVSEIWAKTCWADTAEGQKFEIFKLFKLWHVWSLQRGFQTRWIDSRCLFYSRKIGFRDIGPKCVGRTLRRVKNSRFHKCSMMGVCLGVFGPTESFPVVDFTLEWLVIGNYNKYLKRPKDEVQNWVVLKPKFTSLTLFWPSTFSSNVVNRSSDLTALQNNFESTCKCTNY